MPVPTAAVKADVEKLEWPFANDDGSIEGVGSPTPSRGISSGLK
jgi:hypothetical protein